MEWFAGSINDAIALAKVKGVLFVVAVHGIESNRTTKCRFAVS